MNGVEDNDENVEPSEKSEVKLWLCIREAVLNPGRTTENCKVSVDRLERQRKVAAKLKS